MTLWLIVLQNDVIQYRSDPDNLKWFVTTSLVWIKRNLQIKIHVLIQNFSKNLIKGLGLDYYYDLQKSLNKKVDLRISLD